MIKDKMRLEDNILILSSLYKIIGLYQMKNVELAISALEIIALYSYWVDINLTLNEQSFSMILQILYDPVVGEGLKVAVIKTLQEILNKKMEPLPKIEFLETVYQKLSKPSVGTPLNFMYIESEKGKLMNNFGTLLIASWIKLPKPDRERLSLDLILNKFDLIMSFTKANSILISQTVLDFANAFINNLIKTVQQLTNLINFDYHLNEIYVGLIANLHLPIEYNENTEMERYKEYSDIRNKFESLFDAIANWKFEYVIDSVHRIVTNILGNWCNQSFRDIEMALTLLNYFADFYNVFKSQMLTAANTHKDKQIGNTVGTPAISFSKNLSSTKQPINSNCCDMKLLAPVLDNILQTFISCDVYKHSSSIIQFLYFEVVAKFDRKISKMSPEKTKYVFIAFQSEHGIKNPSQKLRSRSLQIFCRFIKHFKNSYPQANELRGCLTLEVLKFIQGILELAMSSESLFTPQDMNALFESYAVLVITSNLAREEQRNAIEKLVYALASKYQNNLQNLNENLGHVFTRDLDQFQSVITSTTNIINYIIRTTKAFSSNLTMGSMGLTQLYKNVLTSLLESLDKWDAIFLTFNKATNNNPNLVPTAGAVANDYSSDDRIAHFKYLAYSGVRQYFHVMVVCFENEIIPFIVPAFERFLRFKDIRNISDLIPLFIQITTKFKDISKDVIQRLFVPLACVIFELLNATPPTSTSQITTIKNNNKFFGGPGPASTNGLEDGSTPAILTLNNNEGEAENLLSITPITPDHNSPNDEQRDKITLQRSYYSLLSHLVNNHNELFIRVILNSLGEDQFILKSITQGIQEINDPVALKSCFGILRKLIDFWTNEARDCGANRTDMEQFVYFNAFPSCLTAPLKPNFDLKDNQTIQALNECAACLQLIYLKGGSQFESLLISQLFPSLNIDSQTTQEFLKNIRDDLKTFKSFLKNFYLKAKS